MEEILLNSLKKYLNTISITGYMNDKELTKLLFLVMIYDLTYNDFRDKITEESYKDINSAIYYISGSSCLFSYPDFCNSNKMNTLHLGSITEISHIVRVNKELIDRYKKETDSILDKQNKEIESFESRINTTMTDFNERMDNSDEIMVYVDKDK